MTIKTAILNALRAEYPGNLSNQQLSYRLDKHEASIRRTTLIMERERMITNVNRASGELHWQLIPTLETLAGV